MKSTLKTGSVLLESAAIVAAALVIGTGVHLWWPYPLEKQIKWVGDRQNCFTVKKWEEPAPKAAIPGGPLKPRKRGAGSTVGSDPGNKKSVVGRPPPPPPPAADEKKTDLGYREITLDEAKTHFDAQVRFLDARRTATFKLGHVAGAWSLSSAEDVLRDQVINEKLLKEVDVAEPLVLYCTGGNCEESHQLAKILNQAGFKNLMIMVDGFAKWKDKGNPVEGDEAGGPAGGDPDGEVKK